MPKQKKITPRQEAFVREYLKDPSSIPRAAMKAGYSEAYAKKKAHRLVGERWFKDKLNQLNKKLDNRAIMSVEERKEVLSHIARGRVPSFMTIGKDGKPTVDLSDVPEAAALSGVVIRHLPGGEIRVEAKLRSPTQAIDLLNKMGGDYAPEQVQVKHSMDDLTDSQLADIARGKSDKAG